MVVVYLSFCFFFFQAEDGIRDIGVTGVQTCALPISIPRRLLLSMDAEGAEESRQARESGAGVAKADQEVPIHGESERLVDVRARLFRSEERRVGKECRSRWSPYH